MSMMLFRNRKDLETAAQIMHRQSGAPPQDCVKAIIDADGDLRAARAAINAAQDRLKQVATTSKKEREQPMPAQRDLGRLISEHAVRRKAARAALDQMNKAAPVKPLDKAPSPPQLTPAQKMFGRLISEPTPRREPTRNELAQVFGPGLLDKPKP